MGNGLGRQAVGGVAGAAKVADYIPVVTGDEGARSWTTWEVQTLPRCFFLGGAI